MARNTDRWVTPAVVIWGMAFATLILCVIVAAVAFLTWQGFDPQPVVQLVGTLVAALSSLGGLGIQLANRATVTKVERNTRGGYVPPPEATAPIYPGMGRPRGS